MIINTFAKHGIQGMSIHPIIGVWKGQVERTQFVEVYHNNKCEVEKAAKELTILMEQWEIYLNGNSVMHPDYFEKYKGVQIA
jgi:hypothetical protein